MSICPLPIDWLDHLEGRSPDRGTELNEHLETCVRCQAIVLTLREKSLGFELAPYHDIATRSRTGRASTGGDPGHTSTRIRAGWRQRMYFPATPQFASDFIAHLVWMLVLFTRRALDLLRSYSRPLTAEGVLRTALLLAPGSVFLVNKSLAGGLLRWVPTHAFSFGWAAVLAIAILGFSGGYCATRWRTPVLLAFAFAFAAITAYAVGVAASYESTVSTWREVWRFSWIGIPLALAFWTRSAILITDEMWATGRPKAGPLSHSFAFVVAWKKLPAVLRERLIKPREQLVSWDPGERRSARQLARRLFAGLTPLELISVWFPALGFIIASQFNGTVYRLDGSIAAPWRGYSYIPEAGHWLMAIWIVTVLLFTTLHLLACFRSRPSGLTIAADRRVRYGWQASTAFLALALLLLTTETGFVPEPLGLLALSIYACLLALVMIDADEARLFFVRPRFAQRLTVAGATALGTLGVCATVGGPPLRSAALAFIFAAAVPVIGPAGGWLAVNRSRFPLASEALDQARECRALRDLLEGAPVDATPIRPTTLRRAKQLLDGLVIGAELDTAERDERRIRERSRGIPRDDIQRIWTWIPKQSPRPTTVADLPLRVSVLLEEFPALEADEATERARSLIRLVHATASRLVEDPEHLTNVVATLRRERNLAVMARGRWTIAALESLQTFCSASEIFGDAEAMSPERVTEALDVTRVEGRLVEGGIELVSIFWKKSLESALRGRN
jgi:hypothetical protein